MQVYSRPKIFLLALGLKEMFESVRPELGRTSRYIRNEEMSISGGPSRKLVFFRKASSIQSKNNHTTKNLAYKKPLKYTRPHKIDNSC